MSLGVDVGGTFTDLVGWEAGRLVAAKTSTTEDQSDGVEAVVGAMLGGDSTDLLVHGTTVATNALLERRGAAIGLLTDPGFEDLVEIGRQNRPSLYDTFADRRVPVVGRAHRVGAVELAAALEVSSVVVGLVDSYSDFSMEDSLVAELTGLGVDASGAGRLVGEHREFERIGTATVNAYLAPVVKEYLARLERRLVPSPVSRLLVMRSSGGSMTPTEAGRLAAAILLSGPAGGVIATASLAEALGLERTITFDMGGTSTDACRIEGHRPQRQPQRLVDGLVIRMPTLAIHTVGAGGGSIAWADPGGALRVGPHSAGARPGPVCYGRGGVEPTVTDADLFLGRVANQLAAGVSLRSDLAESALAVVGGRLGLGVDETALGVVEVVEATMEQAVRAVSIEEGADPRSAWLVAFGGAGGLHSNAVARRLGMSGVVVPPMAGMFSALGLLLAPPRLEGVASVMSADEAKLDIVLAELLSTVRGAFAATFGRAPSGLEGWVDVRYVGQSHELTVEFLPGDRRATLVERFRVAHRMRNGFDRGDDPIEVVAVRAAATGDPPLSWDDLPAHQPVGEPGRGIGEVLTRSGRVSANRWWRPGMAPGAEVAGPAIVTDDGSTTWIASGERAILHPSGALVVEW